MCEVDRIAAVNRDVDERGVLSRRTAPSLSAKGTRYDPERVVIEDSRTTDWWGCHYCSHRTICRKLPQGPDIEVPVDIARKAAGLDQ